MLFTILLFMAGKMSFIFHSASKLKAYFKNTLGVACMPTHFVRMSI